MSSEGESQRFHKISDSESSGSDSEESVSGWTDLEFFCQGTTSSLSVHDLARIIKKYDLPTTFFMAVPEAMLACFLVPGFVTLYKDVLATGLRLPLHLLAWDLLIFLGIAPGQLAPNGGS